MKAPKKSIKTMRRVVRDLKYAYDIDSKTERNLRDMMSDVKEAVEKQIPVIPVIDDQRRIVCSNCGMWLKYRGNAKYCQSCGQAIDWEEATK